MKLYLALSSVLLGGGLVTWGLYLIYPPAAVLFAGACFVAAGLLSEGAE
jgi:hypothetical protein